MGLMKTTKIHMADKDASRALEQGHTIYVHRFGMPNLNSASSCSVSGAAEVIETIEAAGWKLEHVAFNAENRANGSLVMLFRPAPGHTA